MPWIFCLGIQTIHNCSMPFESLLKRLGLRGLCFGVSFISHPLSSRVRPYHQRLAPYYLIQDSVHIASPLSRWSPTTRKIRTLKNFSLLLTGTYMPARSLLGVPRRDTLRSTRTLRFLCFTFWVGWPGEASYHRSSISSKPCLSWCFQLRWNRDLSQAYSTLDQNSNNLYPHADTLYLVCSRAFPRQPNHQLAMHALGLVLYSNLP